MNKKTKKIVSAILTVTILCIGTGTLSFAAGAQSSGKSPAGKAPEAAPAAQASLTEGGTGNNSKDETVYVIADGDGSAQKVIVSDWIKNALKQNSITDDSALENVTNLKGDQSFKTDAGNALIWNAEGNDIYYQGESGKELPIDMSVSYRLDGKEVTADELAGKSGKVTIRFDYVNKQYEDVTIDGVKTKIYVPFAVLTGMLLDNNQFTDISVTNGKLINDGDRTVVMGIALPGMQDNLGIDTDMLEIPDYVEINAQVSDFKLTSTYTLVTNELFNDINTEDFDNIDDLDKLSDSMNQLSDAMSKLLDGSSQLYDGLSTLLDKSSELVNGIDQLTAGSKQLSEGAGSLESGAAQLQTGTEALSSGLKSLTSNNDSLNNGAKQVFESLLSEADKQLAQAGLTVDKLTISNYTKVLDGLLASLDEASVYKMAYNKALDAVTKQVRAQESVIREKVEASVRSKVLEGVLSAAGQKMTAEQYQAAVTAGKIPSDMQTKITAATDAQMQTKEIQAQIDKNTEAQIQNLISQNMESSEVTSQIDAAVKSAKAGAGSIASLKAQLNSYNQFYQGLLTYTAGVDQAGSASEKLADGSRKLSSGASSLSDGADSLVNGMNSLKDGSAALVDGVAQLKDGAMQLSDGLKKFNEEGIQKLTDALNGDLNGFVDRLRAVIDVSHNYKSFSGISDDMDGNVKFIYKTDSIGE